MLFEVSLLLLAGFSSLRIVQSCTKKLQSGWVRDDVVSIIQYGENSDLARYFLFLCGSFRINFSSDLLGARALLQVYHCSCKHKMWVPQEKGHNSTGCYWYFSGQ